MAQYPADLGLGEIKNDVYRQITDFMLMPGARVSEQRIQQLMSFDFDGLSDLTLDDMFAVNGRYFQTLMWSIGTFVEVASGDPDLAAKVYYTIGNRMGERGWRGALNHFKTDRLSPAQLAWYQDMSHLFYGPHTQAYVEYTDRVVVVTRNGCFATIPPPGVEANKLWLDNLSQGFIDAYANLAPYLRMSAQSFIEDPSDLTYKVDVTKYASFCQSKRAGQWFRQVVFEYID
jgi:hypothetical protein